MCNCDINVMKILHEILILCAIKILFEQLWAYSKNSDLTIEHIHFHLFLLTFKRKLLITNYYLFAGYENGVNDNFQLRSKSVFNRKRVVAFIDVYNCRYIYLFVYIFQCNLNHHFVG